MTKKKSDPVESDIQVSSTLSRDDQYLNLLDEIKTRAVHIGQQIYDLFVTDDVAFMTRHEAAAPLIATERF